MTLTVSYPWDPTGTNDVCYIRGESYALSSINNTYRCIIPESAPFYRKDLAVVHATSGKTLQEGVDYYLGHRYLEVGAIASLELYGSISFINPELFGEIKLDYRTVGGPFIPVKNKVAEYLANYLIDPVIATWEKTFNQPEFYPPVDHEQIWSDVVNTEDLAVAVAGIEDAIADYANNKNAEVITVLLQRIQGLDKFVTDTNFDDHIIDLANPHDVTYDQTDALGATETAVESLKLYASTIQDLAAYINAKGITQTQLDAYLTKYDDATITGHVRLTDGQATIKSSTLNSTVDLNSGNITLTCNGTGKLMADFDANTMVESVYVNAGNNTLRIRSSQGVQNIDHLTFNDKVVIHLGNLSKYLGEMSFGTVHVTVQNTATGAWTGIGTTASPLKLSPILQSASTSVKGMAKLSVATNSTDETMFATSKALADVMALLTGYVLASAITVNGKPLTANITFTKADFGANLVDNTTDLNKPISTAQQTEIDTKAPVVHKHSWSELTAPTMNTVVEGIARLATIRSEVAAGVPAAPSLLNIVYDYHATVDQLIRTKLLKRDTISMTHYVPYSTVVGLPHTTDVSTGGEIIVDANGDPVLDANGDYTFTPTVVVTQDPASWWTVDLPAGVLYANNKTYSVEQVTVDLETLFGLLPANKTIYLHVVIDTNDTPHYRLDTVILPNTKNSIHVGQLQTNATTAAAGEISRRVSFGMFKELKEHIQATTGIHQYSGDAAALVGLDLVENYPMQHYVHQFSSWSIAKTWLTPSYGTRYDTSWYAGANTTVVNCDLGSFASVVEGRWTQAKMWDRLQPTGTAGLTKATATLRNAVRMRASMPDIRTYCDTTEVVLGVYVDNASMTHTLSLCYYQSTVNPDRVRSILYYNRGLASERVVGEFWLPAYELSFATPPGGVYTTWSSLNLYYDIEFGSDQGVAYIQVTLRSNVEWGTPSRTVDSSLNRTVTKFKLSDIGSTVPYREELFNSGAVGMFTRKPVNQSYSWFNVTTPYSKQSLASANMILELANRGLNISVSQLTTTNISGYAPAVDAQKAIVLISPRVITTATGKGLDTFSISAYQAPTGDIELLDSSYLNASMKTIDGANPVTQTYSITVISFTDEIKLIEQP